MTTVRLLPPYVCTDCGRMGNEDDGISGPGGECPDEACGGLIQFTERGYRDVLSALRETIQEALDVANDDSMVTLTIDEMHVALDAIDELRLEIDSKNPDRRKPWEEYG